MSDRITPEKFDRLPMDAVVFYGGNAYQKVLVAFDSMPATRFSEVWWRIGDREDRTEFLRKQAERGDLRLLHNPGFRPWQTVVEEARRDNA